MSRAQCFLASICMAAGMSMPLRADGGPAQEDRLLADGLFARGFYQMALTEYERMLDAHPAFEGRETLLFRAGEAARRQDQLSVAERFYEEIVGLTDSGEVLIRARLRLADMAFDRAEFTGAQRQAAAILALNPSADLAAAALHTLAAAAAENGEAAEARARREELVLRFPLDPHAAYAAMSLAALEGPADFVARRRWLEAALRNPPSPDLEVEALWQRGLLELDADEPAEAARQFDRLWRLHPDHPRVQIGGLTIAWTMMLAGRFEDALQVAADLPARRKEEQPDSWLYLEGVSLRNLERNTEAYERFRDLLNRFPASRFRTRVAFDLSLLYFDREAYYSVIALSEDLLAFPERREDALWLLAESHRLLGQTQEALRRYEELAGRRPHSGRTRDAAFQRALLLRRTDVRAAPAALADFAREHPGDPRAFSSLRVAGTLWSEQGQVSSARRVWRLALDQYPNEPNRAEVAFALASLELREENPVEARRLFSEVLDLDPEGPRSAVSAYWLAALAADQNDPGAETLLRAALRREQSPLHQRNLRLRLARLLERAGDLEAAEGEYRVLLEEPGAPGLSEARLLWLLRRAEQRNDAEARAAVALRMEEETRSAAIRETGYFARAEVELSRGNSDAAVLAWRSGLALGGETRAAARAAYALSRTLLETGEVGDAVSLLQETLRRASRFEDHALQAGVMMALGDAHRLQEDWNEAARMYMGLAVLFDDSELIPRALTGAAQAFERAGRSDEARKALQELQNRFPEFSEK